jgi:hypothetical protein
LLLRHALRFFLVAKKIIVSAASRSRGKEQRGGEKIVAMTTSQMQTVQTH